MEYNAQILKAVNIGLIHLQEQREGSDDHNFKVNGLFTAKQLSLVIVQHNLSVDRLNSKIVSSALRKLQYKPFYIRNNLAYYKLSDEPIMINVEPIDIQTSQERDNMAATNAYKRLLFLIRSDVELCQYLGMYNKTIAQLVYGMLGTLLK